MVKVVHILGKDKLQKEVEQASFLLSNKKAGYLYLGTASRTKFQGFFINEGIRMFKTLEAIKINGGVTKITNKFSSVVRERGKIVEEFTVPTGHNSFIYELKGYKGELILTLDCREASDEDQWDRFYNVQVSDKQVVVNFEKQNDYGLSFVITGKKIKAEKIREWDSREYELDKRRGSESSREIYKALKLHIDGNTTLVFSAGTDRGTVEKEGDYIFRNVNKLKRKETNSVISKSTIKNKQLRMAYNACLNSLNSLLVDIDHRSGILAGFPWLFKFWTRDELIALKAFGKRNDVKLILNEYLKKIQKTGKLLAREHPTKQGCADGTGWFYKRFGKTDEIVNALQKINLSEEGLVLNKDKETWMDTINRNGARLEIQALYLNMLKVAGKKDDEAEFKEKVKKMFWNKKYLEDGAGDATIRPNAFLAYYIYPELLSHNEWKKCFKHIIPKLWCRWGGISTLDKNSAYFFEECTGEKNDSYHSGDSHFYLNNLAALVMKQVDKKEFAQRIKKIIEASTEEILWKGIVGHHAGLSSVKQLRSEGCRCKAVSAAMFVELLG